MDTMQAARLLIQTLKEWLQDGGPRLSAAMAYYSIFSLAPLLIIAVGIAGLVFGEEAVRGHLDDQLRAYVGAEGARGIQEMVEGAAKTKESLIATFIGLCVMLVGASGVFGQLKEALNIIWNVRPTAGHGFARFVRQRILSFGMVLAVGFLLMVSLILTTLVAALDGRVEHFLPMPDFVAATLGFLISLLLATLLFALIFKVLPDADIEWRSVWIGAVGTALLFEAGKIALGFYLGREGMASAFGAAGALVLILLWVYYASCILLFGAEFTQVYARRSGHRVLPSANAEEAPAV